MMECLASDSEPRRRAIEETDRSFVVEASAGTGKTSILIDRILHLVLKGGPEGQPVPLSKICAITFTEKAAGEMKIRLRQKFEEHAEQTGGQGALARAALDDLETASISTFHSFAVALLKERPIEAGLDPRFATMDETQSDLLFREIWEPWLKHAMETRHYTLDKALRHGLSLDVLRQISQVLRLHARSVRELKMPPPPTEADIRVQLDELWRKGRGLLELCSQPRDRLVPMLEDALLWLKNPEENEAPAQKPGNNGSASSWKGGKETLDLVRGYIKEVIEFSGYYFHLPSQRIFDEVLHWIIAEFLPEWENGKRLRGLIDFDDQVRMARDLLARSRSVRREFHKRFATLLVDEFQDTDPQQLEIVLLLSATDLDETNPARLKPDPGRLFIVGDPKQSIYRFRHADIETYMSIIEPGKMEGMGLELLQLHKNYRSVPSILRFTDAVFQDVMFIPEDGRYQPAYLAFGGQGERISRQANPTVYILGDRNPGESCSERVREYFGREAARVAALIARIPRDERWMVHERSESGNRGWRLPTFGDIAVLLPVLTKADMLEDALRDSNIPYVLEGGKFYYARSEVSSAITVLRAIADPNDAVALYGALRSIFFGLSDEDLLRAHIQGLPLDYRREIPSASPLQRPYELLRDLHLRRHERPASETFETLLQRSGAREILAAYGFQSLANLGKLTRRLRALQKETSYPQVVSILQTMDEEGLAESESRLMEERNNAVRIMSIHKAKGLDFPIVFVAGLGLKRSSRANNFLADHHRERAFALMIESKELGLKTPLWKKLTEEDKKREDAELIRLLYVALTRARDHLVLCTHGPGFKKIPGKEGVVPNIESTRLKPLSSLLYDLKAQEAGMFQVLEGEALDNPAVTWAPEPSPKTGSSKATLEQELQELHRLVRETPISKNLRAAADAAGGTGDEVSPSWSRDDTAAHARTIRLGIAFHTAMEEVDIHAQDAASELADDIGARYGLDGGEIRILENMVQCTLSSELLKRARKASDAGGRILRELPFVRPVLDASGKVIEEGKIDLVFEDSGAWVLVDYKTDRIPREIKDLNLFFREKYAVQIQHYAAALHDLGVPVKAAYLLLARTGAAIQFW
jgi:ATP-dependent helicase/nuclease subunit A